ncbi:transposase, MuDR, MULE transposase domain protein [Tanacetum coccineum]|uniref:Transposase, MuDR, MULE transposase domain protein n=1 Tax=Tanacetum coccineum TaxID=301880 RepID=A0ABQ5E0G2_9ASTR
MTSNSAESINNVSRHVRKAPITMLMEWYRALLQKWYYARREKYQGKVYQVNDCRKVHRVDLTTRSCTCRKWQLSGIPYGHVIAVGRVMGCTDCSDLALVVILIFFLNSYGKESTQSSWKRCRQSRPESNIRYNFSGRSQQYEAAYSYNHGRLQEYAQAYNNMIRRSQEYEPAYTNMIGRSQEYEPAYNNMIGRSQVYSPAYNNNNRKSQDYESAYNNMIGRSQEYSPAYNNNNGRSQEYEAAYNNINFSGMAQDPHLTMPFACNQFNFGQTSQQIDSSMSFTWDPIN